MKSGLRWGLVLAVVLAFALEGHGEWVDCPGDCPDCPDPAGRVQLEGEE